MSLESGKKSAEQMRQEQRDMISKAEAVQPTVAVMEPNWRAMIESQKMQVKTMGEILEKLDTLTTEERMTAYLNMQLQLLKEDGQASREAMEQYRQTLMREAQNTTVTMQDTMKSMERQVGKMNEEFGKAILREQERMKNTSKKLFWISMIPSLILVVWGTDAAYLAAGLTNIIDDRPVEDSTTKHYRPERKKHHGQSMGGM